MRFRAAGIAASVGLALAAGSAAAAAMTVSGSGLWGLNAPTTPYSAPLGSYSFSFTVDNPYISVSNGGVTEIPGIDLVSASYKFNNLSQPITYSVPNVGPGPLVGSGVCPGSTGTLCGVQLFNSSLGGGLAFDFGDYSVNFYTTNTVNLGDGGTLTPGSYSFFPNINGVTDLQFSQGSGGTYNEGGGFNPTFINVGVPEPGAWAMMLIGAFAAGGLLRRRPDRAASPTF